MAFSQIRDKEVNQENAFLWEYTQSGEARILAGYGASPYVMVPGKLGEVPVTEIGDYCFSDSQKDKLELRYQQGDVECYGAVQPWMRLLTGKYIEKVILPDSLQKLGNLAFYNCSKVKELQVGSNLTEIGSDAFMNCLQLQTLVLRSGIKEKTGLRQILSQRSSDMLVVFGEEEIEAALFYPEYYEMYDEIGPAHIFALKLTGEGFRARQCFQDGVVDLGKYDEIFEQACKEESVRTLCAMSKNRLEYPVGLTEDAKKQYIDYLQNHVEEFVTELVKKRRLSTLEVFFKNEYLPGQWLTHCIMQASENGWTEGAASMLRWQQSQKKKTVKERYSFEDF